MKKYRIILILLLVVIVTGCEQKKSKIDAPTFNTYASNLGIKVQDVTQYYGYADVAYQTNYNEFKVLFIDFKDSGVDSQGIFLDQVNNIYSSAGVSDSTNGNSPTTVITSVATTKKYTKDTDNGDNWVYTKIVTEDKFYYAAKVDDTMLYIVSDLDHKDTVEQLISTMKY